MTFRVIEIARATGVTPGQPALAWVLTQGEGVVPKRYAPQGMQTLNH
jgi:aryl-alcohol dehydrogenase-like predicted oxidoreductase